MPADKIRIKSIDGGGSRQHILKLSKVETFRSKNFYDLLQMPFCVVACDVTGIKIKKI